MSNALSIQTIGLPQLAQIGFVVRDLQRSMAMYEAMYGPWHVIDGSVLAAEYRGRPADVGLEIAFGHSGGIEIELIQWTSGESPHREFIERGREGMHHVQFRVDDADGWIAKVRPLGYHSIWYKKWSADTTFAYLEREGDPLIIEFLEMPSGGPGA